MLSEKDINLILKQNKHINFDQEAYDNFLENFDYDFFETIMTILEKGKTLSKKEWQELINKNNDNTGMLAVIINAEHFPKELLPDIIKSLSILNDMETTENVNLIRNEESILKVFFEGNFDEALFKEVIDNLPPNTLSNVFARYSFPNIKQIDAYKEMYNTNQTALKLACEKAITNQPALSPLSIYGNHNLDLLIEIDDFEYLKKIVQKHFDFKKLHKNDEQYLPILNKGARMALIHNVHLDYNNEEHVELVHKVFYDRENYNNPHFKKEEPLSIIPLDALKRSTPYIIDRSINYFVSAIKNGDIEAYSDSFSVITEKLFKENFLANRNILALFDVVKNNPDQMELLRTLLIYSNNGVLLDHIPTLPFDEQTKILSKKDKIPPDILKNYFELFVKKAKDELDNGKERVDPTTQESGILKKCLQNIKLSNSTYDTFFNQIDKASVVLYSVTAGSNVIPDNILIKLISKERENYKTTPLYKTPQLIVQMLSNLLERHSNLPKEMIHQFCSTHRTNHIHNSLQEYKTKGSSFLYNNISRVGTADIIQTIKSLNISRDEFIDIAQKVANEFKDLVKSIPNSQPLPNEEIFADFFVYHITRMYDIGNLTMRRNHDDFENLSEEQLKIIYKSFADIIPNEIGSESDFFEFEDNCIEFNEEGEKFVKVIKELEKVRAEKDKIPEKQTISNEPPVK